MEEKKLTIDRIIIYEEPIKQRSPIDAYLLFKRKQILERKNYRAMVYVREKVDNRQFFTVEYKPGFFSLNPGDQFTRERLTELENKYRDKLKEWVDISNSKFIITEPNCNCDTKDTKIHTYTLRSSNKLALK